MAELFREMGIREELAEAMREAASEVPTPVQRAAIPVLRRGGSAVLHGAPGSGVTAAYGLALLDRLAEGEGEGTRALVLVPTDERAAGVAASLGRIGAAVGIRAIALAPGWAAADDAIVVATPRAALDAIRGSRLKLDATRALILDGADLMFELGATDAIETVTGSTPADAQRVVVAAALTEAVDDYAERHLRRALTIPRRAVEPEEAPEPTGTIAYAVAAEPRKIERAAAILDARAAAEPVVVCRTDERARRVGRALAVRGFDVTTVTGDEPPAGGEAAFVLSYDVPFDADGLRSRHTDGGTVLIEARELPHLRRIAAEAALGLEAEREAGAAVREEIGMFRERLRRAAREEDLGGMLLVLEPLFEEFSAAEVAAAAAALLRRKTPEPRPEPAPRPTRSAAPAERPSAPEWTRLFLGTGSRDNVRPGDIVGAITGEARVTGDEIGKIEIRDTFSIVEVKSEIAERVIGALNGTTVKGRSLRVDYDRGPGGSPERRRRMPSR